MLYVDVEFNGIIVKAIVDSGAQMTIMSAACAEKCNLMRLLDTRRSGEARGIGSAKILGKVHLAQMKIGKSFFPLSITILESNNVEFLLGLDMLRRYQALIDLGDNVLRMRTTDFIESVPFLSEKDIPKKEDSIFENEREVSMKSSPLSTATNEMKDTTTTTTKDEKISQLMEFGFNEEESRSVLEDTGWNVDVAAALLFNRK